jgi:hypothetical protein
MDQAEGSKEENEKSHYMLYSVVGDSPHIMIIVLMSVHHFIYTMYNIYTIYTHCSLLTVD